MAESSTDVKRHLRLDSDHSLGSLGPITEHRTDFASPTSYTGQTEYFDWAPGERGPRRRSTDPASPGSPGLSGARPKARARTTYEPRAGSSKNVPPKSKSRFTHNLLNHLPWNRHETTEPAAPDHLPHRNWSHDTKFSESFEATEVWDRKSILSLDGGGIRGYSALLIIKELMKAITQLERTHPDGPASSSYHPLHPNPVIATDEEVRRLSQTPTAEASDSSMWLPCHYFDYMAGTSTGGLISIMLGRLRMNIDDCIADYEKLGEKVFAHSRWCHLRSPLWLPREKYNHKVLQEVVEEVVDARIPKIGGFPGGKIFAFDENRCRVVVVSFQEQLTKQAEKPYLFRTYKNLHRSLDVKEREIDRNPGPAHDLPIWQVARATSAAPTYFKEVTIEKQKYLDGGFGANNPTVEIYEEVRRMNNNNDKSTASIISIGTGKNNEQRISSRLKGKDKVKEFFKAGLGGKYLDYMNFAKVWATNSETAHVDMTRRWVDSHKIFEYYRFNVEQGLDTMKLDEWKQRGRLRVGIGKSLARMKLKRKRAHETGIQLSKMSDSCTSSNANGTCDAPHTNSTTDQPENSADPTIAAGDLLAIPPWFRPRNKTLETIRHHTSQYLARPDVQQWIQECARLLVDGRRGRARADRQRWERACFGAWYQCRIGVCPRGEKEYHDRHALEKHLLDKHSNVYHRRNARGKKDLEAAIERCKVVVH